jgi:hypothetical protein
MILRLATLCPEGREFEGLCEIMRIARDGLLANEDRST